MAEEGRTPMTGPSSEGPAAPHDPVVMHDVAEHPWYETYRLLTGFLQPRPIAFVSTEDIDGNPNLAPFSFYTCVSANPLLVAFSPLRKGRTGTKKDTLRNIEATGQFVIATVTEAMGEGMNRTAAEHPPDESEWDHGGFTPRPSLVVGPACVAESPVNLECTLHTVLNLGHEGGAGNLVIGRVERMHLARAILADDGHIDPDKVATIGRMGNADYTRSREGRFQMERP